MIVRGKNARINLLLLIIVLSIIDFGGMGVYIMSFVGVIGYLMFPTEVKHCISTKRFLGLFILCFFSAIFYCLSTSSFNRTFIASIIMMPLSMYICGYSIMNRSECQEYDLKKLVFTVAVTSGLYGFVTSMNKGDLSAYANYSDAYMKNLMRHSYSIWNRGQIAGTVLSVYLIPTLAILFYVLICLRGIKRIGGSVCCVLAISGSLILGSRANLVILLFSIIVSLILMIRQIRIFGSNRLLSRVLVITVALLIGFELNVLDVKSRVLSSPLFYRISIMDGSLLSADGRQDIFTTYLSLLIQHPFGGLIMETGHSTHNTLLQYGAFGGVICFVIAILFWLTFFVRTIRSALRDSSQNQFFVVPIITSVFLIFMVESVVLSNATMYSTFIMLMVAIDQYYTGYNWFQNNQN